MTNKIKLPVLFLFLTEEHGVDAKPYTENALEWSNFYREYRVVSSYKSHLISKII